MRAEQALALFTEQPVPELLRLLALFDEEESLWGPFRLPARPEKAVLPRYGSVLRGEDAPVLPEREKTEEIRQTDRIIEKTDPFFLTVFEQAGGSYFFSEEIFGAPAAEAAGAVSFERVVNEREICLRDGAFSTFPTVEKGETSPDPAVFREYFPLTEPERTGKAETPHIPTVDELLDELEKRLIREFAETEGII